VFVSSVYAAAPTENTMLATNAGHISILNIVTGNVTIANIGNNVITNVITSGSLSAAVSGSIGILDRAICPITYPIENRIDLNGGIGFSYEFDAVMVTTNIPVFIQLSVPETDYARIYVATPYAQGGTATLCPFSNTFFVARAPYEYYGLVRGSNVFTNVIWQTVLPNGGNTNCLTMRSKKWGGANTIGFYLWTTSTRAAGTAAAQTDRWVNVWVDTWNAPVMR